MPFKKNSDENRGQVSRQQVANWLYCLNWHMKDLVASEKLPGTPPEEARRISHSVNELYRLKEEVLQKAISEGHAVISERHFIRGRMYFCVTMGGHSKFHLPCGGKNERKEIDDGDLSDSRYGHSDQAELEEISQPDSR